MLFRYKCISEEGEKVEGVIEASDRNAVVLELRKMFPFVLEVKEEKVARRKRRRVSRRDLIVFTDTLSISANAGLSVVKALELASSNVQDRGFRETINLIISSVRGGRILSESLAMHPDVFDPLYVGVVRAGESSGELGQALESLSRYLERSYSIMSKVKSAMVYPLVVLGVALGVVFLFLTSIVPKFSEIYLAYGTELPALTQITVSVGNFVKGNILFILLIVVGGLFLVSYAYSRSEGVRSFLQFLFIKLVPPMGEFLVKSDVEKFARIMSMMLSNRVMILQALETASITMSLVMTRRAIEFSVSEVEKGRLLSEVLSEYSFFPPLVVQMIKVGEETGELDKTLRKVSEFYSVELERQAEIMTSVLSPVLIVIVGAIVSFLVLSLFMPMFSLQQIFLR